MLSLPPCQIHPHRFILVGADHRDKFDLVRPDQPYFVAQGHGYKLLHYLYQTGAGYHRPAGKMSFEDRMSPIDPENSPCQPVTRLPVIDNKEVIQQHDQICFVLTKARTGNDEYQDNDYR